MQETIDSELEEKIIAVAYGDCSIIDRIRILWRASTDERVRQLLDEYRHTAHAVHGIPEQEFPQSSLHALTPVIGREPHGRRRLFVLGLRQAYVMIVVVAVLGILARMTIFRQEPGPKYTKAELILAQEQMRKSFGVVAKVLQKTESDVDKKVLAGKVSKPLNKGLIIVREYVTGG
jgi:hypothetical protein